MFIKHRYMDFNFFITDNKSGYKTKEKWFSKNYPEEYQKINNYCLPFNISSFKEKIWVFYHNLKSIPKCPCGIQSKFSSRFDRGYQTFCSLKCANNHKEEMVKRQKQSIQKKWGVDFFPQHKDFINKQKETKKKRYGNENYNNVEKMKSTKEKLYGDSGYNNSKKNSITRRDSFIKTLKEKTKDKFVSYELDSDNITLNCSLCNQDYKIYNNLFNYRTKQKSVLCTLCNPTDNKQVSGLELDLINFVSTMVEVNTKDRSVLCGKELDVFIPSKNLAIEFNGLYWHSDIYKDKKYHLNKTIECNKKGVDLLHVFEDEWLEKSDIVKSIIKNKLGFWGERIYARNCVIRVVDKSEEKLFLNTNHIQGFVSSNISYGLYYNGELVSVMTFGGLRKSLGYNSKEGSYEMLRFCNKLNTNVVGGASKLFKHFIKNYKPKQIISYSDMRYFGGSLYKKLGFEFVDETRPNYFYVINHNRENRFKYRKDVLISEGFDESLTEKEIMKSRGYNRIYDCGNKKWVINL
jgi:hypothetical protein